MVASSQKENILYTGSYDEKLVKWDKRQMKRPIQECQVGGGVWRVKFHPELDSNSLLVACMGGGFKVIDGDSMEVTSEFNKHTSLAYGCDWSKVGDELVIGTCSFYDHQLYLSSFKI